MIRITCDYCGAELAGVNLYTVRVSTKLWVKDYHLCAIHGDKLNGLIELAFTKNLIGSERLQPQLEAKPEAEEP